MPVPDPSWAWRLALHAMSLDASGADASASPFYDVTAYGAVGDGTTDDTTAITDTFDAADATGGGIIYFPPTANYYKITSLITRTGTSKYHLLGGAARYGTARVHQATANTGAFKFAPSSGTANRVTAPRVENLVVSGAGGASSGRGIEFANDGHVEGCFVYGFYDGIYFGTASFYSFVAHTTFTDCDNAGLRLFDTNNSVVESCRFTGLFGGGGAPIGAMGYGILVNAGASTGLGLRVSNCSIEYFTLTGIEIDGGGPIVIENTYFETQQSSSGGAHIRVGTSSTTTPIDIIGNYLQGDGTSGFNAIALDHCDRVTIAWNRFGLNSAIGITSTGSTSNVLLINNKNSPAGTFTLPSSSYTLDPATPPATLGTPALTLGTSNSAGTASMAVRTDATIAAFDATVPVTQAFGDAAATGSAGVAARRDHVHGMPATPASGVGEILISDTPSTPLVFGDLLQNEAQDDLIYADP